MPSHEPDWELFLRLIGGFAGDPVLGMQFLETAMLTETPNQVMEDPEIRSRLADLPTPQAEGPTRNQLLTAMSA